MVGLNSVNMYIVFTSSKTLCIVETFEHAKGIAHGYNHFYCKPIKPDEYFVKPLNKNYMENEHGILLEDGNICKVVVCPHTGKEVVGWYSPGDTDGFPDYLCLHNDNDEQDAEDVAYFKLHNKINPRP